eukprot:CAMPEP_0194374378 /NCGR_PEP_ID=MMETSP0174-20130528/22792_1 /TAXON_ID=216777 /ORGANISM="Proboscia alata, Strain PI-D3" /LENGTH=316 /DNA_ID=CAMNT_0039153915 /DNA_START=462 /DNA_END=1412 /DNA_ORIENTATION=-
MSSSEVSSHLDGKSFLSVNECIEAEKGDSNIRFVDGSWHLKDRDGRSEYEAGPRIKNAKFFDINDIATNEEELNPKSLPHMCPSPKLFSACMDSLDISNTDRVIIYGSKGCFATPRTWYTFKAMGHDPTKLHLMQGSFEEWEQKGGSIEDGPAKQSIRATDLDMSKISTYQTTYPSENQFCDMKKVSQAITEDSASSIVIDARSLARFKAEAPEPRPNLRLGHMPGAFNLPFNSLLEMDTESDPTKFKSVTEMRAIFQSAGVDVDSDKTIICSCGSGVTASTIATALEACGRDPKNTLVYDGSWADWGSDSDTLIE